LHMALVGAIIASQQWLRNEVKVLYQLLYDHAQWVIKQPSDEAASIISGISAGLGTLVVGSVGFVSGTLDAIGSGGITAIPTSPIAGALGSIKALIVVGQLLAGLFVAIYMAYYITLVACGVLLTLGVAVLPFLAGLSLIEGMGGLKVLVYNVRSMVTGIFTMLLLPYIFRIALEIGWLAPGRKIVDIIERAVTGLLEKINELGLGFSNIGQTVNTIGGLAFSDDIRNSLLEAVWTALAVSVGGIVMIILGMMAGLYLIRRAEVIVGQVVGGIGSGLAAMVGNAEGRLTDVGAGFSAMLATTFAWRPDGGLNRAAPGSSTHGARAPRVGLLDVWQLRGDGLGRIRTVCGRERSDRSTLHLRLGRILPNNGGRDAAREVLFQARVSIKFCQRLGALRSTPIPRARDRFCVRRTDRTGVQAHTDLQGRERRSDGDPK
jgi:hypothetical protein